MKRSRGIAPSARVRRQYSVQTAGGAKADRPLTFRGSIELAGKTATGIQVPDEVVAALGTSRRPAVRVTLKGYKYRSSVAHMGGRFMLPISAENRTRAGVTAGDEVDVEIEIDTAPREVQLPSDFRTALDRDSRAKSVFDGLSYSNQSRVVISIERAKTAETRVRRISNAINMLRERRT